MCNLLLILIRLCAAYTCQDKQLGQAWIQMLPEWYGHASGVFSWLLHYSLLPSYGCTAQQSKSSDRPHANIVSGYQNCHFYQCHPTTPRGFSFTVSIIFTPNRQMCWTADYLDNSPTCTGTFMLPGETKNTQCAKDGSLKKEIATSHYTSSATAWKINMYSRQTACFRVFRISVKYHSEANCPCATLNIYSLQTQMNLTHPVSCCQTVSLLSMRHCAQTHTHVSTSANLKMQKSPKKHKRKLYSINWHCYQISSNSHHKRHALILCSAQKWIIPPGSTG